ncbi:uncharacterized protein LOC143892477 [Tasmannia lanceolata]|uniref:uncharacterized protein LOC143892477 n=1 Tax=Tasmannia lanceolata TaxID=3420 RepID=UPI004062D5AD
MQACKLNLPRTHPSLEVTSLLLEPISHSLALMFSDSSFLLYPSLSLFPPSPPSPPHPTLIPPPSTSSSFLRLHVSPNPNPTVLFLTASPHNAGSAVLLRAWILLKTFTRAHINFNRDRNHTADKFSALLDLPHGFSVKIFGSVNVFAVHSLSARKIWVFSVRLASEDGIDLIKCAVIDCVLPIHSVRVSLGFLLLGEVDGVRVFPLRPLVKRKVKGWRDTERRTVNYNVGGGLNSDLVKNVANNLQNGVIGTISGSSGTDDSSEIDLKHAEFHCNGKLTRLEGAAEISNDGSQVDCVPAKHRTVKLRQDSGALGSFFVAFMCPMVQSPKCMPSVLASLKAVSIHVLSQRRFLILDSVGDIHLLSLHSNAFGSDVAGQSFLPSKESHMRRLDYTMKVQMLAVLPDVPIRTQTVWVSDGSHSVHMISATDIDISVNENGSDEGKEKLMHISAIQSIFTSERVQDIIPFATNAILILGQGSIFAYAVL